MITANATGPDGRRLILLGITRENVDRLIAQQPIHVAADTHPGFPADLSIVIVFGETERVLVEHLKPMIGDETKVIAVPHKHPRVSS
jgi:hypothetical protein